eukprot:EG_transcript_14999
MSITGLRLDLCRGSRIYDVSETILGHVEIANKGTAKCGDVKVILHGCVVGKHKVLPLLQMTALVATHGELPPGTSRFPFSFALRGEEAQSYEGYQVTVRYHITAELLGSGRFGKNWTAECNLWIRSASLCRRRFLMPVTFRMQEDGLRLKRLVSTALFEDFAQQLGEFLLTGSIDSAELCSAAQFSGSLTVHKCRLEIHSMELQLCQLEVAPDPSGGPVQSSTVVAVNEIVHGDPGREWPLPMLMQLPSISCGPSLHVDAFQVDWEVHLVIYFQKFPPIYERFPIHVTQHSRRACADLPPPSTPAKPQT